MTATNEKFIKLLTRLVTEELRRRRTLLETPTSRAQEEMLLESVSKLISDTSTNEE